MLGPEDIKNAATQLGSEVAVIQAVTDVESQGSGFLPSGKPVILFEGHIFSKYTGGKFSAKYPTISYPTWTKKYYIGGEGEWTRYTQAAALDSRAAMMSTSWGLFQVMGFNYKPSGYNTVVDFVDAMKESEAKQLNSFVTFIKNSGLSDELRNKNWAAFAFRYNGPGYDKNGYDTKLAQAYTKYSHEESA